MRKIRTGRIVNVSSIYGRATTPLTGWYQASKHALEGASDALRAEVAGDGIKVVLDGQGAPKAVLKTIELTRRRFDEVDEAFAYEEGEGDRSLQYWREAHTKYFTRLGRFAPDMMLWCERFELVERLG